MIAYETLSSSISTNKEYLFIYKYSLVQRSERVTNQQETSLKESQDKNGENRSTKNELKVNKENIMYFLCITDIERFMNFVINQKLKNKADKNSMKIICCPNLYSKR